jgi:hypothetical protein
MNTIRLTRTPSAALAGIVRGATSPTVSGLDWLSCVSGVARGDVSAIIERRRILTTADSDELGALASAAGVPLSALSYGSLMVRAKMHDEEEKDEGYDDDDDRPRYRFVMSTGDPDRARDIVGQSWLLGAFRANPVAPWGHRADMPPIGTWENVGLAAGRLVGDLIPAPVESYDLSMTVARYLAMGVIRTVSVGFMPGEAIPRSMMPEDDPRHAARGMFFDRNELLECSPVTVPMNAGALAEMPAPPVEEPEQRAALSWLNAPAPLSSIF